MMFASLLLAASVSAFSPAEREHALARAEDALNNYYFTDRVKRLRDAVERDRAQLLQIGDEKTFADALARDLQQASGDKHIIVWYTPDADTNQSLKKTAQEEAENAKFFAYVDSGFKTSARLPGNIGYVSIGGFGDFKYAKQTIDDAVRLVSSTSAMIVDLRENGGGDSDSVNYWLSYFFPGRTELITAVQKTDGKAIVHRNYTFASVGGLRYLNKPVYVLISSKTISGGEMFAYEMKTRKRATIIGATTAGAANGLASLPYFMAPHLRISVPDTILRSPITGTNWEGGVAPDVAIDPPRALVTAYAKAVAAVRSDYDPLGELAAARKDPAAALRTAFP